MGDSFQHLMSLEESSFKAAEMASEKLPSFQITLFYCASTWTCNHTWPLSGVMDRWSGLVYSSDSAFQAAEIGVPGTQEHGGECGGGMKLPRGFLGGQPWPEALSSLIWMPTS